MAYRGGHTKTVREAEVLSMSRAYLATSLSARRRNIAGASPLAVTIVAVVLIVGNRVASQVAG
jgi:hypothetical protein